MDVLLLFREESFLCGWVFGGFFLLLRNRVDIFSGFIGWGEEGVFDKCINIFVMWYKGFCLDY